MNLGLGDKVVLITGGTGGIGSQIIKDFLLEGAIVACLIRNKDKMNGLHESLKKVNVPTDKLFAFECDLLNYEDLKTVTKKIAKHFIRIDVLVNCAGFTHEYPFALLDKKKIDEMIDLNLKGPIYLSQAVLKYMYKQKEGSIVNISSISSIKKEPAFMLEWRLKAYKQWQKMVEPKWPKVEYPEIDFQKIVYYSAPKNAPKYESLDDVDPELLKTYEKLGIPLSEQKMLAGVAVDAVFDSVCRWQRRGFLPVQPVQSQRGPAHLRSSGCVCCFRRYEHRIRSAAC